MIEQLPPGYQIVQGCYCLHLKKDHHFLRNRARQPLVFRDGPEACAYAIKHAAAKLAYNQVVPNWKY